jgi:hypothetical protein
VWLVILSDQLRIVALVGRYPTNKLIRRGAISGHRSFPPKGVCGISHRFQWLSPTPRKVPTRYSPVRQCPETEASFSCDLHVLSLPPAFVLSQDQTLMLIQNQA